MRLREGKQLPLGVIAVFIAEQGFKIKTICFQEPFCSTILPMDPVPTWMCVRISKVVSQSYACQ